MQNLSDEATANQSPGWRLDTSVQIDQTAGVGVPYARWVSVGIDATCPNSRAEIEIPEGARFLEVTLDEPAVNGSNPGAGYATLLYRYEDEAWKDPEGQTIEEPLDLRAQPPSETTTINLSEPAQGTWEIVVWPHGPVVNQAFHLQAHAEGQSPPSGDIDGLSCGG